MDQCRNEYDSKTASYLQNQTTFQTFLEKNVEELKKELRDDLKYFNTYVLVNWVRDY